MSRHPPRPPLFPYTPLFRSVALPRLEDDGVDALLGELVGQSAAAGTGADDDDHRVVVAVEGCGRSEEHTSELQSRQYLVCRLLLEKKKKYSPMSISNAMFCV